MAYRRYFRRFKSTVCLGRWMKRTCRSFARGVLLILFCCGTYTWFLTFTSNVAQKRFTAELKESVRTSQLGRQETAIATTNRFPYINSHFIPRDSNSSDAIKSHRQRRNKKELTRRTHVDRWKRANLITARYQLLVYSAYWDERNLKAPCVRVIGATLTKGGPKVFCKLHYPEKEPFIVTAHKKVINEHWNLKYSACFFYCTVPKGTSKPSNVSISDNTLFRPSAVLVVHHNKEDNTSTRGNIALCVKPLHYSYDRVTWFIEFMEVYQILGVEYFLFYNHSMGQAVEKAIRTYQQLGIVSVLPWNLDIPSQKEIRTEGLFAALNDCLYRTMYLFQYVFMVDFDEFVIPSENIAYHKLFTKILAKKWGTFQPSSFVFQNSFFYLYWENDTTAYNVEPEKLPNNIPYLLTQYKTRRLKNLMKYGRRSKFAVVPERALEVGNHLVWRVVPHSENIKVPPSFAFLHHYRICEDGGYQCLKKPSVIDRTALYLNSTLLSRVRNMCRRSFAGACPPSPPLGSPW